MNESEAAIIAEVAKAGIQFYASYMKQKGLTEEQINETFDNARIGMMKRDPSKLPE